MIKMELYYFGENLSDYSFGGRDVCFPPGGMRSDTCVYRPIDNS